MPCGFLAQAVTLLLPLAQILPAKAALEMNAENTLVPELGLKAKVELSSNTFLGQ